MTNTTPYVASTSAVSTEQQTILVIDDHTAQTNDIADGLTDSNYKVTVAQMDTTIWRHIQRTQPDLVILVLAQPDAGALAICQQLKQHESGFLPIILVTAKTNANEHLDFVRTGTDAYLFQPIVKQEFMARVDALLAVRQRFSQLLSDNHQLALELADRNAQLETALQTAQELDLIKTAIISNVNHELRTPLLQVKSSVALLQEDIPPETTAETLINMATQAIDRLENTVTSITQLAESQNVNLGPTNLDESINLAIRQLRRSSKFPIQEYNRIIQNYPKHLPLVLADKRGIAQVLLHLLDNALKFSPDGGLVEVLIEPQGREAVGIGVRDPGIGIPTTKLPHIFESFYQVDASATRSFGGVGVGLTLANMILRQMNSSLQVKSEPGIGSTFYFVLPQVTLPD